MGSWGGRNIGRVGDVYDLRISGLRIFLWLLEFGCFLLLGVVDLGFGRCLFLVLYGVCFVCFWMYGGSVNCLLMGGGVFVDLCDCNV